MPETKPRTVFHFGVFEVDTAARELRRDGVLIRLQDQPFELLLALLECPGEMVTREALRTRIWQTGTFVEFDQGLYTAVARLRDALGDSPENPVFIQTIPRRGYRFLAPVTHTPSTKPEIHEPVPSEVKRPVRAPGALIVLGIAAVLMIATAGFAVRMWYTPRPQPHSIAVLPMQNFTGSAEAEYLVDGFTEELVTQLGKDPSLQVISRTTSMRYKGSKKTLQEIGRELNVERIVEGSISRSSDVIKVTAQLIDARNDRHIWAESYSREAKDFITLQAEVAAVIDAQIHAHTVPARPMRVPANPEAYDAYLRGRYEYAKRDGDALQKSIELFQHAISSDPNFAPAYAGLADSYIALSTYYRPPREVMSLARQAAQRALAIDDESADAHSSLGWIEFSYDWDWVSAEHHIRRAIALNPSYAPAHSAYSGLLARLDRPSEAIAEMKMARQLDPLSLSIAFDTVWNSLDSRRYDIVLAEADRTLSTDPKFSFANSVSGLACAIQGRYGEAIERSKRGAAANDSPVNLGLLGEVYARAGQREQGEKILRQLQSLASTQYVCKHEIAALQATLGHTDDAIHSLEKARLERSDCMPFLRVDPRMDPLRSDPRFQSILQQVENSH